MYTSDGQLAHLASEVPYLGIAPWLAGGGQHGLEERTRHGAEY
jgi:hypothetical protein